MKIKYISKSIFLLCTVTAQSHKSRCNRYMTHEYFHIRAHVILKLRNLKVVIRRKRMGWTGCLLSALGLCETNMHSANNKKTLLSLPGGFRQ